MPHRLKYLFSGLLFFLSSPFGLWGQVRFETSAPDMVAVNQPFRIEFALNANGENFTPPDFGDFMVIAGPSVSQGQSVSIVQGQVTQSLSFTYTYVLQAASAGVLTVGPAKIQVDGESYSTKPFPIEVVEAEAMNTVPQATPRGEPQAQPQPAVTLGPDDILLRVIVNRNKVYKGQPVRAAFKVYSRVPFEFQPKSFPAFNGFWAQELNVDGYDWQRETYKGKIYDSRVIREVLLYPQQSGSLYIEQATLDVLAQVVVGAAPRGSLFDDIFGGGPQVQQVRREISAFPVQITVDELPGGAPISFNGAVGLFQLSGSASDTVLTANASSNYLLKITGTGNLPLIPAPKVTFPASFEQYNMRATESLTHNTIGIGGYRQFEFPFIPRAEGPYEIDPVEFSYFDPDKQRYITLSVPAQKISVQPDTTSSGTSGAVVSGITKEELKILDQDIRFIRVGDPKLKKRGNHWFGELSYWIALFGLLSLAVGMYFWIRKWMQELQNTVLMRNKQANRVALQRLKAAQFHMNAADERRFYEEMLKALWGYMGDKLNIPVANLTKDNIREELVRRDSTADRAERFVRLISECEYAQYSPSAAGQMNEIYQSAVYQLSKFESFLKKPAAKKQWFMTLVFFLSGFSASAQTVEMLWNDANTAYIENDYTEAVRGYEAIRAQGLESDMLYLNLGNAYFKQSRIGKAILNYERALRLSPGDEDVRYNLTVADAYVQDKIDVVPVFFLKRWTGNLHTAVTGNAWAVLSVIFFILVLTGAIFYLLAGGLVLRKAGFYGAAVSLFVFFFSVHAAAKARGEMLRPDRAVVMSGSAPVKSSPDTGSKDIFVLHEGTRVRVKDALGDYCEIVIADGNKGWILTASIEMID